MSAGRVVGRAPRAAHWGPGPLAVLSSFRPLETFAREKCHMDAPEGRAPLRQLPAPFVTRKELPVLWTHTHSFTGDLGLPSCLSHFALCPEQGHIDPGGPPCATRSASADGLASDRILIVSASSPGRPLGEFLVVVPGAGAQAVGGGGHGVNGSSRGGAGGWEAGWRHAVPTHRRPPWRWPRVCLWRCPGSWLSITATRNASERPRRDQPRLHSVRTHGRGPARTVSTICF